MQPCDANFQALLESVTPENPRDLTAVYEFYEPDVTPGVNGFDPADAVERFAKIELTWLGFAYRRAVISSSDITKAKGAEESRLTLTLSNADEDRYAANWITQT